MDSASLPYCDVNEARLRYVERGNGPPLLLVHGLGATHEDWERQIDFFARVFRVIAPDLRGHGATECDGPYTVDRMAADLSQLMEQLKVGPFFVIGHSMGGAVAMQLALFKPERVQKLLLANTLPSFRPDSWRKQTLLFVRTSVMRWKGPAALAAKLAQQAFPEPDQAELRRAVAERHGRMRKSTYLALLAQLSRWSVADKLSWLTIPVLVMASEFDHFDTAEAIAFAETLPDGQCRIVEGAHHQLPLERPDDFNRLAMQFLMPGHDVGHRGDGRLNWLRMDPSAQKKIDVQALLKTQSDKNAK